MQRGFTVLRVRTVHKLSYNTYWICRLQMMYIYIYILLSCSLGSRFQKKHFIGCERYINIPSEKYSIYIYFSEGMYMYLWMHSWQKREEGTWSSAVPCVSSSSAIARSWAAKNLGWHSRVKGHWWKARVGSSLVLHPRSKRFYKQYQTLTYYSPRHFS